MGAGNFLTGQPKCSLFYSASSTNNLIIQMKFFVVPLYLTIFALSLTISYNTMMLNQPLISLILRFVESGEVK